jgi:hypothetical protein
MSGRLDTVIVSYSRGKVPLPWASRDALVKEIGHLDAARRIVEAFRAVGASRPVDLRRDDEALLADLIDTWSTQVSIERLPPGVWDLRCALLDDLHDDSAAG